MATARVVRLPLVHPRRDGADRSRHLRVVRPARPAVGPAPQPARRRRADRDGLRRPVRGGGQPRPADRAPGARRRPRRVRGRAAGPLRGAEPRGRASSSRPTASAARRPSAWAWCPRVRSSGSRPTSRRPRRTTRRPRTTSRPTPVRRGSSPTSRPRHDPAGGVRAHRWRAQRPDRAIGAHQHPIGHTLRPHPSSGRSASGRSDRSASGRSGRSGSGRSGSGRSTQPPPSRVAPAPAPPAARARRVRTQRGHPHAHVGLAPGVRRDGRRPPSAPATADRGGRSSGPRDRGPSGSRPRAPSPTGRLRGNTPRTRSFALLTFLVVLFLVVVVRLVYVQTIGASQYVAYGVDAAHRADRARRRARARSTTATATELAISIPQTTIAADPSIVDDPQDAARRLAPVLGLDEIDAAPPAHRGRALRLPEAPGPRRGGRRRARRSTSPGVLLFGEQARFNPSGDLARALLGRVGLDNDGLSGVEQAYEDQLSGEPGHLVVERDPEGRTIPAGRAPDRPGPPRRRPAPHARPLGCRARSSASCRSRSVRSAPRAASSSCRTPRPARSWRWPTRRPTRPPALVHNSTNDLAVTANYEPGSVNKVITLAAALEEGLVSPDQVIHVPPSLQVADHTYNDSHPGNLTVTDILAKSSNVGTIKIAQMLGEERLDEYLRRFGFGRDTGLGLPHEENGQVPSRRRLVGHVDRIDPARPGHLGHGHADAVRLQRDRQRRGLHASDPGGGHARQRGRAPRRPARASRTGSCPPTTAAQLRAMLAEVIDHGTGTAAAIDGYEAAGKTGTARKPQDGGGYRDAAGNYHYISTFAGLPARRRPQAVGDRRDRRAHDVAVRGHGGGAGVRRDRPVRSPHDGRRPQPGAAAAAAGHRDGRRPGAGRTGGRSDHGARRPRSPPTTTSLPPAPQPGGRHAAARRHDETRVARGIGRAPRRPRGRRRGSAHPGRRARS